MCIAKSTLGLEAASVCLCVCVSVCQHGNRVVARRFARKKNFSEEAKVWDRRENYTFLSSGRTSRRSAAKRVNSHAVAVVAESFAVWELNF